MGKVIAVCGSRQRGTPKSEISSGFFEAAWGLRGDAHAGRWHRQVSLLSAEKIQAFNRRGANVRPGAFGENLVVEDIDFSALPVGTLLCCGDALLEITQIGKACHAHCEIHRRVGDCIMPREGVFARVLRSGMIAVGDEMEIAGRGSARPWRAAVITLSDRAARGERQDESGPAVSARLREGGYQVVEELVLPDEGDALQEALIRLCDGHKCDLILTTGGTGFSARDITPEVTLAVAHRLAPGIAEAMRAASMAITPLAMLSRGVSALRAGTLIVNLPGSPRACMECMDAIREALPHAMALLRGDGGHLA